MKSLIFAAMVTASACASLPPDGSLARLKHDQRLALTEHCLSSPERFGFPNTRSENADLLTIDPALAPNVYRYCRQAAQYLVR